MTVPDQGVGASRSRLSAARAVLLAVVALIGPLVSLVAFGSTGRDDPYITFAAAEAFREHLSIANVNGDPFEQSTSLLFTVVLALLGALLPISTFNLGWALGFVGLSTVGVLSLLVLRSYIGRGLAALGAVAITVLPPLSYWAASGAEQTWVVASLIAVVLMASPTFLSRGRRSRWVAAPVLVLTTFLLRPDAGLAALAGLVAVALLAAMPARESWGPWRQLARMSALSLALIALVTVGRALLSGTFLPQSVMAKAQPGYEAWDWAYVATNAVLPYFLVIIVAGALVAFGYRGHLPRMDRQQALLVFVSFALLLLLMRSGPDWMEAGRLWLPPAALLTLVVLTRMAGVTRIQSAALVSGVLVVNLVSIAVWSIDTSRATFGVGLSGSRPGDRWELVDSPEPREFWAPADGAYNAWNAVHAKDAQFLTVAIPLIRDYLERSPGRPVTVGAGDAGMVFYFLGHEFGDQLEFVDRWSLVSPSFSGCSDVNRTPVGTGMSFGKWFQWIEESRDCVPQMPDIIFDNASPGEKELEYYDLVFQQQGAWVRQKAGVSHGNAMWLAFRKELP